MKAFDIEWDIEDSLEDIFYDELYLPAEVEIPDDVIADCIDEEEICDAVADYLSDEYGYCVLTFGLIDIEFW